MKRLVFALFIALVPAAIAVDVERGIEQLARDLQELGRDRRKYGVREAELRRRLEKPTANTPETERVEAELSETRQILRVLEEREHEAQGRLRTLQQSTEHRVVTAIASDSRRPTKIDISGVWTSEPNLTGYTVQLEQRGASITGRGFYWGCLGTYDPFRVTGSYRSDVLSLTFSVSPLKRVKHVYEYRERQRLPRFRAKDSGRNETMVPASALH